MALARAEMDSVGEGDRWATRWDKPAADTIGWEALWFILRFSSRANLDS
jgi:hypothetical protein